MALVQYGVVEPAELAGWILARRPDTREFVVVDVRTDDYDEGGHIVHALHLPATFVTEHPRSVAHMVSQYETVIFHCALSQSRGPTCAMRVLSQLNAPDAGDPPRTRRVLVLRGGFRAFVEAFGDDSRLVVP